MTLSQVVSLPQAFPQTTLSDVMEAVLATVGPSLAKRRHSLIFDLADSLTSFSGDRSTITQIIADVLQNASRYSLTKRTILRVVLEGGQIVITVRDQSRGIGWPMVHELAETHGRRIKCSRAETEWGSEVVVRFQVPEPGSDDSWVTLHHRVTVARPLLKERELAHESPSSV
jgi:signal transduction histidine kinase